MTTTLSEPCDTEFLDEFTLLLDGKDEPMGFEAGDANLYRYVGNSPTNYSDPKGLWRWFGWFRPTPPPPTSSTPGGPAKPQPGPPPSFNPPAGCYYAGLRPPADVFIPAYIGDLPHHWAGEGWGNPLVAGGSSVAPAIPFTYQMPRNFPITQCNCAAILASMRMAAELLKNSGRLNEYQTQMDAIGAVEQQCSDNQWPTIMEPK